MASAERRGVVLISMATVPGDNGYPTPFVRSTYKQQVVDAGMKFALVHPSMGEQAIRRKMERADGILLTGGTDFRPSLYGAQEEHHKSGPFDDPRDEMDLRLARWAYAEGVPILGICRGAQGLIIERGGTLHQHVADIVPGESHALAEGLGYPEVNNNRHRILLAPGSRLQRIFAASEVDGNSAHHQAGDDITGGLVVVGRSPGGVVEGVEHETHPYMVGAQNHPEADHLGKVIFVDFAGEVKQHASRRKSVYKGVTFDKSATLAAA